MNPDQRMKHNDLVLIRDVRRKNGRFAGQYGLIVGFDAYNNPRVYSDGEVNHFHRSQIRKVVLKGGQNESC